MERLSNDCPEDASKLMGSSRLPTLPVIYIFVEILRDSVMPFSPQADKVAMRRHKQLLLSFCNRGEQDIFART